MITINLREYIEKLDIDKLSKLNLSILKNYEPKYQVHFPSGAMEIKTIVAPKELFDNIMEFLTHILALRYARYVSFELPENFLEEDIEMIEFDVDEFKRYISGYIEGYMISAGNHNWKIELNIESYIKGYNITQKGTGLLLICEASSTYLTYFFTSID